ncbi:MAG: Gfo/Idh/MocA family oxidoreductase [Elusimicrobiota bacterium]|jgi:predicted dehydrogenase|nr:Gfo/Idh/MocA family oxidoreductase [Elusimicrobiota bacterium]
MSDKKVRFGVIGAGKIGTFHVRTLAKMQDAELVGVCDKDPMRAQKLAWEYNCAAYTKHEDLIPQIDAVIVAAPTELHHQIGMYCLEHGVHTLMEKPIASTMEQARELIAKAAEKKIILQIGHVERFNPAVLEAFKYIKNPKFIAIKRLGTYDPRMANIGVVLDLMIHDIDLLLTMLQSEIVSIDAVGLSAFSGHEDIANARLKFADGCTADITASRASFERARYMNLYQQDAYISVDFMNTRVKIYRKKTPVIKSLGDIDVIYPNFDKQLPITSEIMHFVDCIQNDKTPGPSGEKGSKALQIALKIADEIKRYNVPQGREEDKRSPVLGLVSDIGGAAKVAIDETLGRLKRGK